MLGIISRSSGNVLMTLPGGRDSLRYTDVPGFFYPEYIGYDPYNTADDLFDRWAGHAPSLAIEEHDPFDPFKCNHYR